MILSTTNKGQPLRIQFLDFTYLVVLLCFLLRNTSLDRPLRLGGSSINLPLDDSDGSSMNLPLNASDGSSGNASRRLEWVVKICKNCIKIGKVLIRMNVVLVHDLTSFEFTVEYIT